MNLQSESFKLYDETRDFSNKAFKALCYAPFTSLYFDNAGDVRVCCHNYKFLVGSILDQTIDEIWSGESINTLRADLKDYKFGPGCDFCARQTAETFSNAAMKRYDKFTVVENSSEQWPQQMEFSISNACNLECIMCRGFWSSSIRSRREKLPPLPRHYGDSFFESLWKYLPHLRQLKFLGGEPFLINEYYKLWDKLINEKLMIPCHVTTNGTQYNHKVERVLSELPFSFSVSMDGATKETVESIRVNAKYEEVIENSKRFRDYAKEKNTSFSLTFCLMRQNWHEFGQYCLLADSWDVAVGINTVINPPEFGIYTLPLEDLRKILDSLEKEAPELESALKKNKNVWFGELERIRARCKLKSTSLTVVPAEQIRSTPTQTIPLSLHS